MELLTWLRKRVKTPSGARPESVLNELMLDGANTCLQSGISPLAAKDGLLTAEEVTGLDLLATELVVEQGLLVPTAA